MKRVFLIVLDSLGTGGLPDAQLYNDAGANTLKSISESKNFCIPNLIKLGLGNIDGINYVGKADMPLAAYSRCAEKSAGKDTTTGHWEIAGLILPEPFPTFPEGFPEEVLEEFSRVTKRGILCNKPYSGTEVIRDYGQKHMMTGDLIVYTSADSVFQIAAHEDIVPREQLYECCIAARKILTGKMGVGRVIARPFNGKAPSFYRTDGRHDFSLEPTADTLLDKLTEAGKSVISVGKISDIFAGRGISESHPTKGNDDGCRKTLEIMERDFNGLCFVNLVDFDMLYGHRNDVDGYALALSEFDGFLGEMMKKIKSDDALIITADHGCDPAFPGTDHTREYVPLLIYGKKIKPENLGTRASFSDIGTTIADIFNLPRTLSGESFKEVIL